MPNTSAANARCIAQRLSQQVEQHAGMVDGKPLNLTISIGAIYVQQFSGLDFQTKTSRRSTV